MHIMHDFLFTLKFSSFFKFIINRLSIWSFLYINLSFLLLLLFLYSKYEFTSSYHHNMHGCFMKKKNSSQWSNAQTKTLHVGWLHYVRCRHTYGFGWFFFSPPIIHRWLINLLLKLFIFNHLKVKMLEKKYF